MIAANASARAEQQQARGRYRPEPRRGRADEFAACEGFAEGLGLFELDQAFPRRLGSGRGRAASRAEARRREAWFSAPTGCDREHPRRRPGFSRPSWLQTFPPLVAQSKRSPPCPS